MSHLNHPDDPGHSSEIDDEEEEAFVIQLFLPRTGSIGSEEDLFDQQDDEKVHNPLARQTSESSLASKTTTASLRHTEKQLKCAEKNFLSSGPVRTSNVSLEEVRSRFSQHTVPTNPLVDDEEVVENYMESLVVNAVNDSVNTASPNMIGHMTTSLPYFMRPLSRLVTTMNQNVVKTETANTITFLEREAMAQLHEQIYTRDQLFYEKYSQNPRSTLGVFTSGGTLANVTAMWVARNLALGPKKEEGFSGIESEGLTAAMQFYNYTGAVIIGSELLHYSMSKTADVLGLGTKGLLKIPFDNNFQVRTDLMEKALEDCKQKNILVVAVLGVAGATETGSVDDLAAIAQLANRFETYFHVDAAWGGPLIFSRKHKQLLAGIENADSVTVDGHKQLYMPMGCGFCFFRDPALSTVVKKTAKYIIREDSHDIGKFTLEGSRPANAVYLHSNLNIFGVRGYEILINRSVRTVQYMVRQIELASRGWFELVVRPMSNILLYRAVPPSLRKKVLGGEKENERTLTAEDNKEFDRINILLQERQTLEGRTFVSRTTVQSPVYNMPIVALRVVIANPLTFKADIDRVLQNQVDLLCEILGEDDDCPVFSLSSEVPENRKNEREEVAPSPSNEKEEKTSKYWAYYWNTMPTELRRLFKDDKDLFLTSLIAPGLRLEDDLFSREQLEKQRQTNKR